MPEIITVHKADSGWKKFFKGLGAASAGAASAAFVQYSPLLISQALGTAPQAPAIDFHQVIAASAMTGVATGVAYVTNAIKLIPITADDAKVIEEANAQNKQ